MAGGDRRSSRRFELQLALIVRWMKGASMSEFLAVSKDVSSRGIYFLAPRGIEGASAIEIVMTLPHEITGAGPIRIRCWARIQRTELPPGEEVGVGASVVRYEFLPREVAA